MALVAIPTPMVDDTLASGAMTKWMARANYTLVTACWNMTVNGKREKSTA